MKQRDDYADIKVAVANSSTGGALVGTAINTTGYGRARFIFSFGGDVATTATVSGNIGIWKCATSGGTYTSISSAQLSQVSSGVVSDSTLAMVIDTPTDPDYVWLKVSGSISSTAMCHSAVVELYNGVSLPPSSSLQELVTV